VVTQATQVNDDVGFGDNSNILETFDAEGDLLIEENQSKSLLHSKFSSDIN
jgi:hypothetical protein